MEDVILERDLEMLLIGGGVVEGNGCQSDVDALSDDNSWDDWMWEIDEEGELEIHDISLVGSDPVSDVSDISD